MKDNFPVSLSCEVLGVSVSGYFEHERRRQQRRPSQPGSGRLKVGRLYGRSFATRRQAMDEVIDWLAFYNHRRLHSTLGYLSPRQYEERWVAAQLNKAA